MIMTVGFGFQQRNEIVVIPVGTVFAFTQLRSTMPGAPEGFGTLFLVDPILNADMYNPGDVLGRSTVIQRMIEK